MKRFEDWFERQKEVWDNISLEYVPKLVWRLYGKAENIFAEYKFFLQKITRKSHMSNRDFWGLDYHLIKIIAPKIRAFYEFTKRHGHGYPACLENQEEWIAVLKEMTFAFEYSLAEEDMSPGYIKRKRFYKKWNLESPWRKCEKNKTKSLFWHDYKENFYYNPELASKYAKRAQKGFQLFGDYFQSLWD